jgi:DNA excision repair protein ERCC-2
MSYRVAVRALCEFAAKCGDLDLRFTPAPSAQEGIAGHTLVQGRRGPDYQAEIPLSGQYCELFISGRADGYDPVQGQLEEIKTHRGDLSLMPDNQRELHWAQLRIYGHLFLQRAQSSDFTPNTPPNTSPNATTDATTDAPLDATSDTPPDAPLNVPSAPRVAELRLALVYFDVDSERETVFYEQHNATTLAHYFEQLARHFLAWARQEQAHRQQRDQILQQLAFPHAEFRLGQRELSTAVYNAQRKACCLLAQAPTGIGKTIGTLFPLLKACPGQKIDKIFFLSAKSPGRQLALDALTQLPAAPLRALELVARDQACEHPELACHGASCPLAHGFYDRLPAARQAAVAVCAGADAYTGSAGAGVSLGAGADAGANVDAGAEQYAGTGADAGRAPHLLDQATVRAIALAHQICPYYLSQELVRWADVVIGDYNYWFDISAMLHGLTKLNQWRVSLLVDEAHNLLSRARSMYSAELASTSLRAARRKLTGPLKKALDRVQRQWRALPMEQDWQTLPEPPGELLQALQQATGAIADHMLQQPQTLSPELQQFYFDALHFTRVAELFDDNYLCDLSRDADQPKHTTLALRNLIPASLLRERFTTSHAATLFSATLTPHAFYQDTLGLPDDSHFIDVASPFAASQLQVRVVRHLSTRYQDRAGSLPALIDLIAFQYRLKPGNYLAFFSSFAYLEQAVQRFVAWHPNIPWWQQTRNMAAGERQDFLARFAPGGQGIGFAVLGGSFAEGIDLPGSRLVGAFIATLGLPQINPVNQQLMQRMQQRFGQGYDYTYLYPGLQKVVQAAGRVIRTPQDLGQIFLLDDRFARPEVQALLPRWWKVDYLAQAIPPGMQSDNIMIEIAPIPAS